MGNKKQNRLTKKQLDLIVFIVHHRMTQKDAAEAVGVNEATVWRWKQDKMFLDELEKASRNKFRYLATVGQGVLESLMEHGRDENIKLKAAQEALDRGFGKVTNKVEVQQTLSIEDVLAAMKDGSEVDGE